METLVYIFNLFLIALPLISIIISIIQTLSLWFIFKKENFKSWFILIPFYNIYIYYKICKLPFWTIFVLLVNIFVYIFAPFKLSKKYNLPNWLCILSIFVPFLVLPYIAFFGQNSDFSKKNINSIKTINDLNKIEEKLNNDATGILNFEENTISKASANNYYSKTENVINDIENNSINDDFFFDNINFEEKQENSVNYNLVEIIDTNDEEIIEIIDQNNFSQLTAENINKLEESLQNEKNINILDNAHYNDYTKEDPSNVAIAFGGKQQIEEKNIAKQNELICERCGSSLIGANGFCPGCGAKV